MKFFTFLIIVSLAYMTSTLNAQGNKENPMFKLSSPAFNDGETIPMKYTGEGEDISPPLKWANIPNLTEELVLICDDPDAPNNTPWVHWLIYNLSPTATNGLPEHMPKQEIVEHPVASTQGENAFGKIGYNGPMPPPDHGPHRYFFNLYALNKKLRLPPALLKSQLLTAMKGHIIGEATLIGKYRRISKQNEEPLVLHTSGGEMPDANEKHPVELEEPDHAAKKKKAS